MGRNFAVRGAAKKSRGLRFWCESKKNGVGSNALLFNHTSIENALSSTECDLNIPTKINFVFPRFL